MSYLIICSLLVSQASYSNNGYNINPSALLIHMTHPNSYSQRVLNKSNTAIGHSAKFFKVWENFEM